MRVLGEPTQLALADVLENHTQVTSVKPLSHRSPKVWLASLRMYLIKLHHTRGSRAVPFLLISPPKVEETALSLCD